MVNPISPQEAEENSNIPDFVIQSVNELIKEKYDGNPFIITNREIKKRACKNSSCEINEFQRHWLNIENIYRNVGWKVVYDSPSYNKFYEGFFRFDKK